MAGPVSLKHSCIMYRNMQAFWHVTLIKINYYYYYSQNWPNQRIPFPRISQLDQYKFKHFHKIIQLEWSKFICTFSLESDQDKFIKFHRVMQPDQYSFYIHLFTKIHPTGPVLVYNRTSTSLYISLNDPIHCWVTPTGYTTNVMGSVQQHCTLSLSNCNTIYEDKGA